MVNWQGAIILSGGLWVVTLPIVLWFAIKGRRWLLATAYSLPILWFVGGYLAMLL
jgi:hypothetical protein